MRLFKLLIPSCVSLCVSCGGGTGSVEVATPTLAYVAPGVEVVADWDEPVFFADGFYWYLDGDIWYRSARLGGERVVVHDVPRAVARIHAPATYAHFHARTGVAARPIPEHRTYHAARMAPARMPAQSAGRRMGGRRR